MITPLKIARETMTPEKKASAKNDLFAYYIGRPLSYVLTVPFLYTGISPNAVSVISVIPLIAGFVLMCLGQSLTLLIIGWACFFLWNLLDGVDGNIARYKKQFSPLGSVYDAMSGYIAMILSFFAWGVAACHNAGKIAEFIGMPYEYYIVLGALSGIFAIFPRFIMHKVLSTVGRTESVDEVKDKSSFGFVKLVALNLISISGFVQVFMLIAVIFDLYDVFTLGYCLLNFLVMVVTLASVLKTGGGQKGGDTEKEKSITKEEEV